MGPISTKRVPIDGAWAMLSIGTGFVEIGPRGTKLWTNEVGELFSITAFFSTKTKKMAFINKAARSKALRKIVIIRARY